MLIWHPVLGASGYRIVQGVDTRPVGLSADRRPLPSDAEKQPVATFVVRDTSFSQSSVPAGRYVYAVAPLFRMLNDSVEVPASFQFSSAVAFDLTASPQVCRRF